MPASAPDSSSSVVHDPLGDRVVVSQPSGGLVEHLQFAEALARTPSFETTLKDRIARLANFRHSSYARVRRIHHAVENDGRPILVSAHVPGRRLVEILEASERTRTHPTTSAVLAVTRQLMASAALLHDFGPDVFHGALGPERVVIGADSRVIITEYVLGPSVEQTAAAWGARRLWAELRIAVLPDQSLPQFGRRSDILQIGLITLAALLGRPLRHDDFPDGVPHLLEVAAETTAGGAPVPLRSGLRSWLERAMFVTPVTSYKSLFEAQKAFTRLIQEDGYGASVNAWNAFVEECDAAEVRRTTVVVIPGGPAPEADAPPVGVPDAAALAGGPERDAAGRAPAGSLAVEAPPSPADALTAVPALIPERPGPQADAAEGVPGAPIAEEPAPPGDPSVAGSPEPTVSTEAATEAVEGHARPAAGLEDASPSAPPEPPSPLVVDPFGPWPVAVPSKSAATLLEAFEPMAPSPQQSYADALTAAAVPPPPPAPDAPVPSSSPQTLETMAAASVPDSQSGDTTGARSQTAYGASFPPARETSVEVVTVGESTVKPAVEQAKPSALSPSSMAIDWTAAIGSGFASEADEQASRPPEPLAAPLPPPRVAPGQSMRVVQLGILAVLAVLATVAALYAPAAWTYLLEGPRRFGQAIIRSDPPGATVTVDGIVRGKTPVDLTLRAGPHEVELQSGGSASTKMIVVPANASVSERRLFPNALERGGVRITTYPTTGKVAIDGTPRGETPLKVSDLTPGEHVLLVETPLGAQEQDIVVEAGKISEVAVPTAAWVRVVAPYELKVTEEGRMFGTTGNAPVMVPPGPHGFDFSNQQLALKLTKFLDVPPGQLVTIPLDLPVGMMNLYSDQVAEVWLDGKVVGNTPISSLPTPLGPHEVSFRNRQYGEVRYSVMVTLTAPVSLTVTFRK